MTDHTAPERSWIDPRGGRWVSADDAQEDHGDIEYIRADLHRAEVDALVAAAYEAALEKPVKTLLKGWLELASHCTIEEGVCCCGEDMGSHHSQHQPVDHGEYIASQLAKETKAVLALTPADARAALRAHTEAAVRRALKTADLEAQLSKSMAHFLTADEWKGYKRGVQEYAARIRALDPAQFTKED